MRPKLGGAPRTSEQNVRVFRIGISLKRLQLFDSVVPLVWRGSTADPQSNPEGPVAQGREVPATKLLHCTEQSGRALELLSREKPQRIPHEHVDTAVGNSRERIEEDGESGQPQVGLRLSAAGGKPDQIHHLAILMRRIADAAQRHE